MKKLEFFLTKEQLIINPQKSNFFIISNKKETHEINPTLIVAGETIEQVKMFKYLGVTLTSQLSTISHIEHVLCYCRRIQYLIKRNQRILETDTVRKLFCSYVLSKVLYCSSIYWPLCKTNEDRLNQIQKNIFKTKEKDKSLTFYQLCVMNKVIPLTESIRIHVLKLIYQIKNGNTPQVFSDTFRKDESNLDRRLRSFDQEFLHLPFKRLTSSKRTLLIAGIEEFNKLPRTIRQLETLRKFETSLKEIAFENCKTEATKDAAAAARRRKYQRRGQNIQRLNV